MNDTIAATSRSDFLRARGLRHHVRCWGEEPRLASTARSGSERPATGEWPSGDRHNVGLRPSHSRAGVSEQAQRLAKDGKRAAGKPMIFLGHGWLDVSATFQPMVEPLLDRWQVLAPDWRGFGYSEWPQDGYWFHDYVADLEAIIDHYSPDAPVLLIGHSMGAQVTSLYAGLRPSRVRKLVVLDGLALPDMALELAPKRFRRWLDQLREPVPEKTYPSFEDLAQRVLRQHPRLTPEHALFIAHCWGREDGHGRITLCADPKHRLHGPGLYRAAESEAVWREITAPTLFIDAANSEFTNALPPEQRASRRACFKNRQEVVIKNAGHMLHFEAPLETAKAIAAFLAD